MSDADQALEAAKAEILRVREAGGTHVDLKGKAYHALTNLPEEIGTLADVTYIELDNTQVTDLAPLISLRNLTRLDLIDTPVTDLSPLAQLSALTDLDLSGTKVSDLAPIAQLSDLTRLFLSSTQVTDLAPLAQLSALTRLYFTGTQVSDLAPLAQLSALTTLYFNDTQVADLAPLAQLSALTALYLNDTQVTDLSPLAQLSALTTLDLNNTQVTDLAPLAQLSALTTLDLNNTQVTDLTPLAQLSALTELYLSRTQVADLAPLTGLTSLRRLWINGSKVNDVRPVIGLEALGADENNRFSRDGLNFQHTPASRATPELMRLSQPEGRDYVKCYRDTVAYLKTLPRYPEPLPRDLPENEAQAEDPQIPGNRPAPLQVVEVDGILRPAYPGDALEADGSRLAEQGWATLREFLEDLADQRERIDNSMPQLGKALARLEAALGNDYAATNPIAIGTHGQRVIRQSGHAHDMLLEADAADIQEFAAAVALFLERFPDWRTYREEAANTPIGEQDAVNAIPDVRKITDSLDGLPEIDPEISNEIEALTQDVLDDPADPVVRTGMVNSVGNLLAALATPALAVLKACKREAGEVTAETWSQSKKSFSKTMGAAIGVAAAGIFIGGFATLTAISVRVSAQLPWLENFLRYISSLGP